MSLEDRERVRAVAGDANRLLVRCTAAAEDARARLAAATADLFIPSRYRLSDARRAAMLGLAEAQVRGIERALRHALAIALADDVALAHMLVAEPRSFAMPVIEESGVLRDADYIAALIRRVDGEALIEALRGGETGDSLAARLAADSNPAVAQAAAGYAEPRMGATAARAVADPAASGLPAELQHRLVWWVAAALRRHLVADRELPEPAADQAVMGAAYAVLAGYDEARTPEGRAIALARALHAAGRIDDALLADAAEQGHVALAAAGLAARGGLAFDPAWDMATDPDPSRLCVLLRSIEVGRIPAARIALAFAGGDPLALVEAMAGYDDLGADRAREAVRPWRLDAGFRRAIDALGEGEA